MNEGQPKPPEILNRIVWHNDSEYVPNTVVVYELG